MCEIERVVWKSITPNVPRITLIHVTEVIAIAFDFAVAFGDILSTSLLGCIGLLPAVWTMQFGFAVQRFAPDIDFALESFWVCCLDLNCHWYKAAPSIFRHG